jgi:hypothetical protein
MILYHGSNVKIDRIDLSKSNVGKDFGVGFYLTPNRDHALGQAQRKIEMFSFGAPTLNIYFFDENELQKGELAVKTFDGYTLEWAEFVLMNRQSNSRTPLHGYDIVVGPVANDTVGYQIRRLLENLISMEQFLKELKYPKEMSIQYFFGSEKALKYLKAI